MTTAASAAFDAGARIPAAMPQGFSGNVQAEPAARMMTGIGDAAPALPVPSEALTVGATAWVNNKKINALWSINQNRNSWIGVEGVGWKKLANNSDSAIVALTMLGAHAREKGSVVNYREEDDGMVREMYVW